MRASNVPTASVLAGAELGLNAGDVGTRLVELLDVCALFLVLQKLQHATFVNNTVRHDLRDVVVNRGSLAALLGCDVLLHRCALAAAAEGVDARALRLDALLHAGHLVFARLHHTLRDCWRNK